MSISGGSFDHSRWLSSSPFIRFLGLRFVEEDFAVDLIKFDVPFRAEFGRSDQQADRWHGGVVSAVADTVGALAVIASTQAVAATVNLRTDFLRPVIGPTLRFEASVRKAGRQVSFIDVEVFRSDRVMAAIARGNYAIAAAGEVKGTSS